MVYQIDASFFVNEQGVLKLKNNRLSPQKGMLLIYADWCGYCTRFKPDYKRLDSILKQKGITFPLYAIEDKNINSSQLKNGLNFSGYPTLKIVESNGTLVNYTGSRDIESLFKFIKN